MEITEFIRQYGDIAIFFGLFFAGEAVLFPAMYLALLGIVSITHLIMLTIAATVLSDVMWYALGIVYANKRRGRLSETLAIPFLRKSLMRISALFDRFGPKMLVGSKFIYGTRTATQFVAGYKRMPRRIYILYNAAAVGLWFLLMLAIGSLIAAGYKFLDNSLKTAEIALAIVFVIMIPAYLWIRTFIRDRWSASLFPPTTKEEPSEQ